MDHKRGGAGGGEGNSSRKTSQQSRGIKSAGSPVEATDSTASDPTTVKDLINEIEGSEIDGKPKKANTARDNFKQIKEFKPRAGDNHSRDGLHKGGFGREKRASDWPAPALSTNHANEGKAAATARAVAPPAPMLDRWNVGRVVITVVFGDLTTQNTEGIVNSCNEQLKHNKGIAGSLKIAAGEEMCRESDEWVDKYGEVEPGRVAVTGAGRIAGARKIFHTVGPQIASGDSPSKRQCDQLASCMKHSLAAAAGEGITALSVPAISTGIYGFPVDRAATILVSAAVSYLQEAGGGASLEEIRFVLSEVESHESFKAALGLAFINFYMPQSKHNDDAAPSVSAEKNGFGNANGVAVHKMDDAGREKKSRASMADVLKSSIANDARPANPSTTAATTAFAPDIAYLKSNKLNKLEIDGRKIIVVQGDIVSQRTDGIVNAANSRLAHGAGVAGAIRAAGGNDVCRESDEWVDKYGEVEPGRVAVTGAGRIAGARKIFHTVGPQIASGDSPSKRQCDQLASCMKHSLAAAAGEGITALSVPAISTGIYGFPVDRAATILVSAAVSYLQEAGGGASLEEIRFVLFDSNSCDVFRAALSNASEVIFGTQGVVRPDELPIDCAEEPRVGAVSELCQKDRKHFSAAGVLLYRFVSGELRVLVGVEYRIGEGSVWNILGGTRNGHESPVTTAVREFWEESGKFQTRPQLQSILEKDSCISVFLGFGKYVLFLAPCPSALEDLDERYNSMHHQSRDVSMEMSSLMWARWEGLVTAGRSAGGLYSVRLWRNVISYPLSGFLKKLISNKLIVDTIYSWTMNNLAPSIVSKVADEIKKVAREKTQEPPGLTHSQRLRLSMPEAVPDTSPITTVAKTDSIYRDIIANVPESRRANVISIRKVNVKVREAEYKKTESELQANGELVEVMNPCFHGTPERWRATNIAFKGFDLSIRLNGRAYGDGVYAASSMDTPLSYCGNSGSILNMKCLRTKDDFDSGGNPRINVFRKAPQVLTTAIIDFASASADRSVEGMEQQQRDEARKALEKYEEQKRELEAKEKAFISDSKKSYIRAIDYYFTVISRIQGEIEGVMASEDTQDLVKLWKKFELERLQFRASPMAPIYADKADLIAALKSYDVVVVTAATGSGKSTQLPQYINDDVIPDAHKKKRIAVLQPKRFNAVSLAQRVSQERGHSMGSEVGYSLGLGDVCVSPGTRIEYMTHGLFIARAKDMDCLLNSYSAVVLDEAHHRSIDVDMCFAILRKCLLYVASKTAAGTSASGEEAFFKVVVASATLTNAQLQMYQDFLAPSPLRGCIMHARGHAFPVMVLYRPEAEPNYEQANSFETSKALAAYATQVAIQLIQTNGVDGNILIFMPGESIINQCIDGMMTWALFSSEEVEKDADDADKNSILSPAGKKNKGGDAKKQSDVRTIKIEMPAAKGERKKTINVGVYPFHGKVTETERQKMLLHKDQDCVIIFSTNVAETGLTLPNVRYVVDTGLERRVSWNIKSGMQEMRTVQITKSSMNQRAGRAGRVASGVCVRLYSEATATSLADAPDPEIENGMLLKTVLNLNIMGKENRESGNNAAPLELLTEVPAEARESAERSLQLLGALSIKDGTASVTELGITMAKIGLPLRIARFLIACDAEGCLGSGVVVAAMMSVSGSLSLLPRKGAIPFYLGTEFLHSSGDHLTLLNIFVAFEKAVNPHSFCARFEFDIEVLESALRCRDHLEVVFCKLKFVCADRVDVKFNSIESKLLQCLCFGYADQLMSSIAPGQPGQRFSRVQSEKESSVSNAAAHDMAAAGGLLALNAPISDGDGWQFVSGVGVTSDNFSISDDQSDTASMTTDDAKTASSLGKMSSLGTLNLASASSLWALGASSDQQFAVFCSILLTDTQKGPSVEMVSYIPSRIISEADKKIGLGKNIDVRNLVINEKQYPISGALRTYLIDNSGAAMKSNFTKFVQVTAKILKAPNRLVISAPTYAHPMIERRLAHLEKTLDFDKREVAEVEYTDLTDSQIRDIISVLGVKQDNKQKQDILNILNETVENYIGGRELYRPIILSDIFVKSGGKGSTKCSVLVNLSGSAKQFMSMILGALQSSVAGILRIEDNIPIAVSLKREKSTSSYMSENLAKVSSKNVPAWDASDPRGSAMLCLAHVAVWKARCCVYGGFIRDFIIRDEKANDVDVGYRTGDAGYNALRAIIIEEIGRLKLSCTMKDAKGMANAITVHGNIDGQNIEAFDVDLVDLNRVKQIAPPPGVDTDVGNLVLELAEGCDSLPLKLKINKPHLVSLADSLSHCKMKEFVFYYEGRASADSARLIKYLNREWTCLNRLPEPLLNLARDSNKGHLLRPLEKYKDGFYHN